MCVIQPVVGGLQPYVIQLQPYVMQAEAATPPKGSGTDAGLSSSGVEVEVTDDSLDRFSRLGLLLRTIATKPKPPLREPLLTRLRGPSLETGDESPSSSRAFARRQYLVVVVVVNVCLL